MDWEVHSDNKFNGVKMAAFDIETFVARLKKSYENWDAPVITLIAGRGGTPYEILISTLLSLRTKDEVTAEAYDRLSEYAKTPEEMLKLGREKISDLIYPVGFYPTKSSRIIEISEIIMGKYGGEVPDDLDELLTLPGVGRKTANLVLIEGFGKDAICVDTHVHRISNRIGYIRTKNPDQTEFALRRKLPRKHWIQYNEILVAFGQLICRPISPFCSKCPVSDICRKIGVDKSR